MEDLSYNIIYAADDGFAEILGVSLCSLFENNQSVSSFNIKILDSGISKQNKNKIVSIFKKYKRKLPEYIKPIDIEEKIGFNLRTDRGSMAQYSRLYLADLYPSSVKKVLYLDCDTIVLSSIEEIWNINLGDNIIAALNDAFSSLYRRNIGLRKTDIMFNSGVMLIDLDKWRKAKIEDQLTSFILMKQGNIQQGDQGALNAVLSTKTKVFSPRFNMVSIFYDLSYKEIELYRRPVRFYSEKEIIDAKKDPVIIHFTSSIYSYRPWFKESTHTEKKLWIKYLKKTPWSYSKLKSGRKTVKLKLVSVVFKITPKSIFFLIGGLFQAYLRPLKNTFLYSKNK